LHSSLSREKLCEACSKVSIILSRYASDIYVYYQGFLKNFVGEWPELCFFDRSIKPTLRIMKLSKYLLAIAVLTVALTVSEEAHLDFVGAIPKQDVGNNSPPADLEALGQ